MSFQRVRNVCLLLCALSNPAAAQIYAELAGSVRDPSGAGVAGADILAVNQETGLSRSARTGSRGAYVVSLLPPGTYRVAARSEGFRSRAVEGVGVSLGGQVRVDIQLEIGPVEDVIEVVGSLPLLQRDSAEIANGIDQRRLTELPVAERNYTALLGLASNVTTQMDASPVKVARQGGERSELTVAVAGQRQEFNRYTLDGVENTNVNFNTFMVRPSIDALAEVKIQSGIYSAEYGRSVSQVLVGTKSGNNEFHGTLFEFHKNERLNARPWLATGDKIPFASNQLGYVLGGPIKRNRAFFLSNMEVRRDRETRLESAVVPGVNLRAGDFSLEPPIHDPLTREFEGSEPRLLAVSADPFPNQAIPVSRRSAVAEGLLEFYPEPNLSSQGFNYRRSVVRRIDTEQYLQRFDLHESDGSRWTTRFNHGNERSAQPRGAFPTQSSRIETTTYQLMVANVRSLGPRALNDLRIGYSRFRNESVGHFAFERNVVSKLGIEGLQAPDPAAWDVPSVGLVGWTGFGGSRNGPWSNRDHTLQLLDSVSFTSHGHSFKIGGELRRDEYNQVAAQFASGSFTFTGDATADPVAPRSTGEGFADFLLGAPSVADRIVSLYDASLRATSWAFFLQDTWRIGRRLTLDWGLRYEYTPPYHEADRGIVNAQVFDIGVGAGGLLADTRTPILTRPGVGDFYDGFRFRYADVPPVQSGDQHLGRRLVASDANDWAPRLGIAYSPTYRWVIRSGFGVFYSQDIGQARFEMARNLSGRDRLTANQERPDLTLERPWSAPRLNTACSNWDGVCISRPFLFNNVHGRRTPYVMQWMFDLQRQIADSIRVQAGYHGNGGRRLERLRPFNQGVSRGGPSDRSDLAERQPWPQYGILQQVDGVSNSTYHALNLKAESRYSDSLAFTANYTWSKSIDYGSAIRNAFGDRLFPIDHYDLSREKALSQFHVGHRFATSFLYPLPYARDGSRLRRRGFAARVLGGWQLGGFVSVSAGQPIDVGGISDRNRTGATNFPDATGINPFVDNPTADRFWNVEAFDPSNPELAYRNGNAGRTVLRAPGLVNWDASLLKNIPFSETQKLQLRLEAFNALNQTNWLTPGNDSRNRNSFGTVSAARPMRVFQFGIKYLF